jgi:hypothetical protein
MPEQGCTAVAIVEANDFSRHTAAWLADILDIGGVIVQIYPPMKSSEQLSRLYEDRTILPSHLCQPDIMLSVRGKNLLLRLSFYIGNAFDFRAPIYYNSKKELLKQRFRESGLSNIRMRFCFSGIAVIFSSFTRGLKW